MRIHWFQHAPFEGLGAIEDWAAARRHELTATRFHAGQLSPSPDEFDALIVMGGPMSVHDEPRLPWLAAGKHCIGEVIRAGKPLLGVCLGAQLAAEALGGRVTRNPQREIGWFLIQWTPAAHSAGLCAADASSLEAFHWHGETFDLPAGAVLLASSEACRHQAFALGSVLGLQFHLETTANGAQALIEHCPEDLAPGDFVQTADEMLRDDARFRRCHAALFALLDWWSNGGPSRLAC